METLEKGVKSAQRHRSDVFFVNFERISHFF